VKDFIVFEVKKNRYAIDLEFIQRIAQIPVVTDIPNSHGYIDGMISYENRIIKIVNFRKMTHICTYDDELKDIFIDLKNQHTRWVETLGESIKNGVEFHLTTNPHHCNLGKWLDAFASYDDQIISILKELNNFHKQLHQSAIAILNLAKVDKDIAMKQYESSIVALYDITMRHLDQFIAKFDVVANSLQKLLLYQTGSGFFAIKVDEIIDIVHIETKLLENINNTHEVSEFLELEGVVEIDNTLVSVIKSIKLPMKEVA